MKNNAKHKKTATKNYDSAILGGNLAARRRSVGMPLEALSQQVSIPISELQNYERGRKKVSTQKLADIINVIKKFKDSVIEEKFDKNKTDELCRYIDAHVGQKLKEARINLKIAQKVLGDKIGVQFQQIQKYEKGSNRIGAGRLKILTQVLGVDFAYFFEGLQLPQIKQGFKEKDKKTIPEPPRLNTETIKLVRHFTNIKSNATRKTILEFVRNFDEAQTKDKKKD